MENEIILEAIELKEEIKIGNSFKGIKEYFGHPNDFLGTTIEGEQVIIPRKLYQLLENRGLTVTKVKEISFKEHAQTK